MCVCAYRGLQSACVSARSWNGSAEAAHGCQHAIVTQLASLANALPALNHRNNMPSYSGGYNLFAMVDPCAVPTVGIARFQTYMTMLYGAAGLMYRPYTTCGSPVLADALHTANARLTTWSDKLGATHTAVRTRVAQQSSATGHTPQQSLC